MSSKNLLILLKNNFYSMKVYFLLFVLVLFSCKYQNNQESLYLYYHGNRVFSFYDLVLKNDSNSYFRNLMYVGKPIEILIDEYELHNIKNSFRCSCPRGRVGGDHRPAAQQAHPCAAPHPPGQASRGHTGGHLSITTERSGTDLLLLAIARLVATWGSLFRVSFTISHLFSVDHGSLQQMFSNCQ